MRSVPDQKIIYIMGHCSWPGWHHTVPTKNELFSGQILICFTPTILAWQCHIQWSL